MAEPTVLGYIKEQPERLKYVFENKDVFVKPFVDVFTKNNIKKEASIILLLLDIVR